MARKLPKRKAKRKTPANLWTCRRKLMLARRRFLTGMEIVGADFALVRMQTRCSRCFYRGTDECMGVARFGLTEVREVR